VNDLIKAVKKKEVRKQGTPSNADRPLEEQEFNQLITTLVSLERPKERYMIPTICKFQFHLNARLDDTCHMKYDFIKPCPQFPFAVLCNVGWSKNVHEERDCPDQLMMGAMDPHYCILLTLAIYLEMWLGSGDALLNPFMFGDYGVDPKTTKTWVRKVINDKVFDTDDFRRAQVGKIGTHSVRKYSSTWMRRHGAHRDDADKRGRWTGKRKQVDVYIDLAIPYADAKCASILCIGGPCKYVLKEGSNVSDEWLLEHVVPNIQSRLDGAIAKTLARALLWAAFDNEVCLYVPTQVRERIRFSYHSVPDGLEDENPVKKYDLWCRDQSARSSILMKYRKTTRMAQGRAPTIKTTLWRIN
jgi:hypothetical protein